METRYLYKGVKGIDERAKAYIEKKLQAIGKLLESILVQEVEIELDKKGKFRLEVMIETPYHLYRGEETAESIEASIDLIEGKLRDQILGDKERLETLRRRGGRSLKKKMVIDEAARF